MSKPESTSGALHEVNTLSDGRLVFSNGQNPPLYAVIRLAPLDSDEDSFAVNGYGPLTEAMLDIEKNGSTVESEERYASEADLLDYTATTGLAGIEFSGNYPGGPVAAAQKLAGLLLGIS